MKRVLSLALVVLMGLALLAGCGSGGKKPDAASSTPSVQADESIFSQATVKYADENGEAVYTMVRAEALTPDVTEKALALFTEIRNVASVGKMKNQSDATSDPSAEVFEILIGKTNRPESQQALQYLEARGGVRSEDFIIATIGNKIVITAYADTALPAAIDYFIKNYVAVSVEGGIKHVSTGTATAAPVTINGRHLGGFKIVRPHYNSSYITQMQIEELISTAQKTYSYSLKFYEDAYETEGDYEIVVGNTNRPGVESITNTDEYKITISGKKVYLNGGSVSATAMAVSEFTKLLSKGALTDADSVTGSYSTAVAGYDSSKYYTYKWGDDFEGSSVDATKWYHVPEGSYSSAGLNGRTSIRSSDPDHVYVNDGKFVISAGYNSNQYIGGMIMTDRTMLYRYGYLEMSALLPEGDGLWTSLWLDSRWHNYTADQGAGYMYDQEIDVNECFGNSKTVAANCHKWPTTEGEANGYEHTSLDGGNYSAKRRVAKDGGSFSTEFHTFGYLWDEDECTFTCDGEVYFSYKNNETPEDIDGFHTLSYLRLSAAIGFANNPQGKIIADDDPAWYTTNKFMVDYVHIYQLDDGNQQMVLGDGIK